MSSSVGCCKVNQPIGCPVPLANADAARARLSVYGLSATLSMHLPHARRVGPKKPRERRAYCRALNPRANRSIRPSVHQSGQPGPERTWLSGVKLTDRGH